MFIQNKNTGDTTMPQIWINVIDNYLIIFKLS